ncbi:ras-like protein family member 11A [Carlito syrichta]|uniref:small monomeric GTPase n=1 Tax=Carlito syrichta TaxID=1868482 RepID=A0A1U7TBB4_CARSF|nr:ras-like protein family member 11A [Carlito syrichta]
MRDSDTQDGTLDGERAASSSRSGARPARGPRAPRVSPRRETLTATLLRSPGKLYSRLVCVEGDQLSLQIQDTPGGTQIQDSLPQVVDSLSKCVQWAEGFLLVYSITDYDSYLSIRPLYQHIRKVHPDSRAPVIIVGNKGDLLHARQVQTQDGIQLANELGSLFLEISTSENYEDVCDVFQHLCKEVGKLHNLGGARRRVPAIPRPRSPNMQDLKRRFKQALVSKVKAPSTLG